MENNHDRPRASRQLDITLAPRRAYTDEQLEIIAAAFGSHLIRNAPPNRESGAHHSRTRDLAPR